MFGMSPIRHILLEIKRDKERQDNVYRKYLKMKTEEIKMLNAKAYQNGFRDGMSLDQKYPQTFTFMGIGIEKLTEIVCKHLDEEENKMTREEAEKKLSNNVDKKILLDALEALGLIKFDEPKRKYIFFPNPDEGKDNVSVYQDDVIKTLKVYGYVVGKETDFVPYKTTDDAAFIMELKKQGYKIIKEDNPK